MRESKISNIAITIDKVMHVLQSMGTMEPPIRELSFKEVGSTYRFIIIINRDTKRFGKERTVSETPLSRYSTSWSPLARLSSTAFKL